MQYIRFSVRIIVLLALVLLTVGPPVRAVYAQDAVTPIALDEAGFGLAQMETLAAQEQAAFTLDLKAGDRVTMDLQGESDALQVTEFVAPYGPLVMAGVPEASNYLAWAPEDGAYSITVANVGDGAAGFVLRIVVTPAPLPAQKVLTADANGQTIPVTLGEPFQVALDVNTGDGYAWTLDPYDTAVLAEGADAVTVPLGTMPGALSQQIFTFQGVAAGATPLAFTNARAGGATVADTYSVTIEVMAAGEEPQAESLTLDDTGSVQATGALDPQGMVSYAVELAEGDAVQAAIMPADTNLVLTVVGADGNPLLTDHAGASSFGQTMPVSQVYTFKVINFGDAAQAYTFDLAVGDVAADDAALGAQLVRQFFDTLVAGNKEQLAAMLAPAFQLLRSSGEVFDATSYPAIAPVYKAYVVDNLKITRAGDVLVATYTAQTDAMVDGSESLSAAAPRLTVFQQIDGEWKLAAHANFGPPPAVEPAPTAEPAAVGVTITENDRGGSIRVAAGSQLVVELPGNPTTGYAWQVAANDESILLPIGYAFTPDSAAAGAGGVERFTFHVMAPGAVNLELANSRPWETDVPPAQTFAVAVEAVAEPAPDNAGITVGAADNGSAVTILPGTVLLVSLDGATDGMWMLTAGDAMVVQPMGDWQALPAADASQTAFQRSFLGVGPGQADLQFEFMNADGSMAKDTFVLTVEVPAQEPGSSGAVDATEADAGGEFALVTGDTLVVRLPANPTTGYDWRVVSTNDALLPAAGDPVYAVSSDLTGAGGVYTFRFLAKSAGEATVQLGEFAPGADNPDKTLDFNATIVAPAPLTGNTVTATADDAGKAIELAAGDWLSVELESNPSTGYLWLVTANDGAVLRLLPESGYTGTSDMPGAPGMQRFAFRALTPGTFDLAIGLFPPGGDAPEQTFDLELTVK